MLIQCSKSRLREPTRPYTIAWWADSRSSTKLIKKPLRRPTTSLSSLFNYRLQSRIPWVLKFRPINFKMRNFCKVASLKLTRRPSSNTDKETVSNSDKIPSTFPRTNWACSSLRWPWCNHKLLKVTSSSLPTPSSSLQWCRSRQCANQYMFPTRIKIWIPRSRRMGRKSKPHRTMPLNNPQWSLCPWVAKEIPPAS